MYQQPGRQELKYPSALKKWKEPKRDKKEDGQMEGS